MKIKWLKLDVNILNDEKIRLIRGYPDGDKILVLWIGLLTMAMKSSEPGVIKIADGLPYSDDELSKLFNLEIKTVQLGIELFMKFGMIQSTEGGMIEIVNFRKHQSIDEIEYKREKNREKVANWRRKKELLSRTNVTVTCNDVTNREDKIRIDKNRIDQNTYDDPLFNEFWNLYDYKKSKPKCYKSFIKLSDKDKINCIKSVQRYVDSTPDKNYRKHPLTYINQRGWEDEIVLKALNDKNKIINPGARDFFGIGNGTGKKFI